MELSETAGRGISILRKRPLDGGNELMARFDTRKQRKLFIIPIVHNAADLGSFAPKVLSSRSRGSTDLIDDLWVQIGEQLLTLDLDFPNLKVYQDSLPHCGFEITIVKDLAGKGSANFRLLCELMDRGATLMGTESPELLLRELEFARNPERADPESLSRLAIDRDRYIAKRIDQSLQPGEEGLLLIGMLHEVRTHLPRSIEVHYPFTITP